MYKALPTITESVGELANNSELRKTHNESRGGLWPIVRQRITARGVQPVQTAAYRFESLYGYGAVEPMTGAAFFLARPQRLARTVAADHLEGTLDSTHDTAQTFLC
jgi:hypothetical protein